MYETRKTCGTGTYEVRLATYSPIEGPTTVVARRLNHVEALFLADVLNRKGWSHQQAYETVSALVEADCLHEALALAMAASNPGYQTQAA